MLKHIFIVVSLIFFCLCKGYAQPTFDNERAVSIAQQQLKDISPNQERIDLLLKLSRWFVLKELDANAIKQGVNYTDQAIALSAKLNNKAAEGEGYLLRSHLAQIQHDYKKGISAANNAVKLSEEVSDDNMAGEAYVFLWSNNALNGMDYADRIPFLLKAYNEFYAANNKRRQADCLGALADLYTITRQTGLALNSLKRALELYQKIGYTSTQSIYDLLGITYFGLGDYKSAIQNGLLAIKAVEETGDTSLSVCTYYNRLGISYMQLNDLVHGRKYLEKSIAIAIKYNDDAGIYQLSYNIASLLLREKKPQEALRFMTTMLKKYPAIRTDREEYIACSMIAIYQQLNRYSSALPYVLLVEKIIAKDSANDNDVAEGYDHLIPFYIATGNLKKAEAYNKKLNDYIQKQKVDGFIGEYYAFQFQIDSANGNYVSAIRNYQRYIGLKDSSFDNVKNQQIDQLSIFFETEKKDKDIQVLKKESQLQSSHLRQAELMRNIILGGSLLLLIILLLLLHGFRLKQKTNKLLQQQQDEIRHKNSSLQHLLTEKEWLVKEIHHRVKNNLHMVVGLLASQSEFLKGEEALSAIADSQHRIQAMSLIHQKLYQTESLSSTDMPSYIFDLTEYLKDSFDKDINIQLDIAKVEFSLAHSIPIGLILNEAITNAIKYAFPHRQKGHIKISLQKQNASIFHLTIADDGIGLPKDFNEEACSSLGLLLMRGLSTDLEGTFNISSANGTTIDILFKAESSLHSV
jgi:two-component sensor histidine kinase